jgi:tetratricopeptide (TPR) repeat protein
MACHALGDYREGVQYSSQNLTSLEEDRQYWRTGMAENLNSITSRNLLAWNLNEQGRFEEARKYIEEAKRIGEIAENPFSIGHTHMTTGYLHLRKGDLPSAVQALERALDYCRNWNLLIWIPRTLSMLGYANALSGNVDEGRSLIDQGIEQAESKGTLTWHSIQVIWSGEIHLLASQIDEALRDVNRGLELSRERSERGYEAWTLRLHGEILSHTDALEPEKAEDHYRQGLSLATELGMRPLVAHCRKGLGALYGRTGQEEKGREELTAAMDMYRDMEMTFWLEKAEEALAEVG